MASEDEKTKYEVYTERLTRIFKTKCPKNVKKIPSLIMRYGPYSYLHEFYVKVCQKYDEVPEPRCKAMDEESSSDDDDYLNVQRVSRTLPEAPSGWLGSKEASKLHDPGSRAGSAPSVAGSRATSVRSSRAPSVRSRSSRASTVPSIKTKAPGPKHRRQRTPKSIENDRPPSSSSAPSSALSSMSIPTPKDGSAGQQYSQAELRAKFDTID